MSTKTRLALDATYAAAPRPTGIGVYSQRLIEELPRCIPEGASSQYELVLAFRPGPYWRQGRKQPWPASYHKSLLFDSWFRRPRARLFHGLNQRLPRNRYPVEVVTIHDRFPPPSQEYATGQFRQLMGRRIVEALPRAARVITVSNAVRKQLLHYDPELDSKIRVVHLGADPAQPAAPEEVRRLREQILKITPSQPYFLNVGVVQTRKNISAIVQAMKPLRDYHLVLTGGEGYGADQIKECIRREGMQDRVHSLAYVDKDTLRRLYSGALALVFPSLEETFGMPIVEAMSYGLPVITSNVSAMPEVAGEAALLVDPRDIVSIREAIQRLAEDEDLAQLLRRKGVERARQFSWSLCAERTWQVYLEALEEHL